jgi:hypothetical protein
MYGVSAAFLAKVRQVHTIATRLDVCSTDGTVLASLYASDGEVTIDATRSVRREATFTVPDPDGTYMPTGAGSLLSNLSGNELRPYRGVIYDDGSSELVPLGVLPIRTTSATNDANGPAVAVTGQDRSTTISRSRWTTPYVIANGTALEAALTALLTSRMPGVATNFPTTGLTVPATTFGLDTNGDPWADAQSLATAAGYDLFFDALGVATLAQPTDPTKATAVLSYADDATGVTITSTKEWDGEKGYNGCVAVGESSTTTPVQAVVWDDDPSSPTYYLGQYGAYPEFLTSPLITTQSQAQSAAQAQLARRRGVAQKVTWDQLVNPAHDANDAVSFTNSRLKISNLTVVLDSVRIPWKAGNAMSAVSRSRQVS